MPSKHIRTFVFGMIVLPLMGIFFQVASNPVVGPFLGAQIASSNTIQIITASPCPTTKSIHNKVVLSEDKSRPGHFLRDTAASIPCSNLPHNIMQALQPGINQKVSIYDTVSGETSVADIPTNGAVKVSLADPNNLKQNIELLVSTDPAAVGTFLVVEELDANDNTIAYYEWNSAGAGGKGVDFIFLPRNSKFRFTAFFQQKSQSFVKTSDEADKTPPDFTKFINSIIPASNAASTRQLSQSVMRPPNSYCSFYDVNGDGINSSTALDANGNPINNTNADINILLDIVLGVQPLSACQNRDLNGDPLGNCNFVGSKGQSTEPDVVDLQRLINFYASTNTACEEPYISSPAVGVTTPVNTTANATSSVEITTQCDQPGSRYYLTMLVRNPITKNYEVLEEVSDLCENWETQPLLIENFDGTLDYAFGVLNGNGPDQGFTQSSFLLAGSPPAQYQTSVSNFAPQQLPNKIIIPTPINPGIPELEIRLQRYDGGIAQESYWKVVSDIGEEIFYLNDGEYEVEISLNGQSDRFRMNTNDPTSIPDFSSFLTGAAPGPNPGNSQGPIRPPAGSPELDIAVLANGLVLYTNDVKIFDGTNQVFCENNPITADGIICTFPTPGFKSLTISPNKKGFASSRVNVNVGVVQSLPPVSLRFSNLGEELFQEFLDYLMDNSLTDKDLKNFIDFAISKGL
ncbi:MAG: hypothetical protein P1V18_03165 [Candidatus Gracilibacteria bacterium]|nr:hypothetical protein [Candidatus Gracilibacteria bacterium]